jgi:hypothetical protein
MRAVVSLGLLVLFAAFAGGCATSAPDSSQFAQIDEFVVDASYPDVWESTKAALRERELLIYTRDKRGIFVAFTDPERRLFVPHRTQITINLTEITPDSTRIEIETIDQEYGVKLLTYPGWHARQTEETPETDALIAAIQGKAGGGPLTEGETVEESASLGQ